MPVSVQTWRRCCFMIFAASTQIGEDELKDRSFFIPACHSNYPFISPCIINLCDPLSITLPLPLMGTSPTQTAHSTGFSWDEEFISGLLESFPETIPVHMRGEASRDDNKWFDAVLMGRKTYDLGLQAGVNKSIPNPRSVCDFSVDGGESGCGCDVSKGTGWKSLFKD